MTWACSWCMEQSTWRTVTTSWLKKQNQPCWLENYFILMLWRWRGEKRRTEQIESCFFVVVVLWTFYIVFLFGSLSLTHSQILAPHYINNSRQVLCGEHDTATIHGRRQSQLHRDASEQNFKKSARHGNGASRERASTLGCKKTSGSLPLTQG